MPDPDQHKRPGYTSNLKLQLQSLSSTKNAQNTIDEKSLKDSNKKRNIHEPFNTFKSAITLDENTNLKKQSNVSDNSQISNNLMNKSMESKGILEFKITETRNLDFASTNSSPFLVCKFGDTKLTFTYDDDNPCNFIHPNKEMKVNKWIMVNRLWKKSKKTVESSSVIDGDKASANNNLCLNRIIWNVNFTFDVFDIESALNLLIFDSSCNDKSLGSVLLPFKNMLSGPIFQGKWDLIQQNFKRGEQSAGEIYVHWKFRPTLPHRYGPGDFEILRLLGKGTFGQVFQVEKKDTKCLYAMKVIGKKHIIRKKEIGHTLNERNILAKNFANTCPFVISLKFSFQTKSDLYLVTDFISGGELFSHLQKEGRFSEGKAKFYCAQIVLALDFLHSNNIIYRDLKPENILLDAKGDVALCDFGLSKSSFGDRTSTFCGTTEYFAPEVILDDSGYTKLIDFWSLGVLMFEMCCGWSPFYAPSEQQMYSKIIYGKVKFPMNGLSINCRRFIKNLLNRNPRHRLGAKRGGAELKDDLFFIDIDWVAMEKKSLSPPFKPKLHSAKDISYFDPMFTRTPTTHIQDHFYRETCEIPSDIQEQFAGFTFNGENTGFESAKSQFNIANFVTGSKYEEAIETDISDVGHDDSDTSNARIDINKEDKRKRNINLQFYSDGPSGRKGHRSESLLGG